MKKHLLFFAIIVTMVILTACGNTLDLKKDQAQIIIGKDKLTLHVNIEADEDMDIGDYKEDFEDADFNVKKIELKNDYLIATLELDNKSDDFEDFTEFLNYELDEYIDDFWNDYDDAEDEDVFISTKTKRNAKADEMEKYEDAHVLMLANFFSSEFDELYITVPNKIIFYSENCELINKNTVQIDDDSSYLDAIVFN